MKRFFWLSRRSALIVANHPLFAATDVGDLPDRYRLHTASGDKAGSGFTDLQAAFLVFYDFWHKCRS